MSNISNSEVAGPDDHGRPMANGFSRRELIAVAGVTIALAANGELLAKEVRGSGRLEHGKPLLLFDYGDVQFAPGPHLSQIERTHEVLMGIDEDSLLRPFRMAAGLAAPGNDLDGWYKTAPRFVGETFGQWLSALARYFAATGDPKTREKVLRLSTGYLDTITRKNEVAGANRDGNPIYAHDKFTQGIADLSYLNMDPSAALRKVFDCSSAVLEAKAKWIVEKPVRGESYNFAETYFVAWERSGDTRFFDLAKRDLDDGLVDRLAAGVNNLATRHAYTTINALCGAAKAYLVLGEDRYLKAAQNGLRFAEAQAFVTGGYGPFEGFLPKPAGEYTIPGSKDIVRVPKKSCPGDSIEHDKYHFETGCGSFAHFKLTRYLLRITKDPRYGDSMERVMYNCALGVLPMNKFGKAFYQSNYGRYATKTYFDGYGNAMEDEWPCCSGTLPQLASDYRISAYFRDASGVFVNLFIPSTLRWKQDGAEIRLTQSGDYPLTDDVMFTMRISKPSRFSLHLRVPAWAVGPTLKINGEPVRQVMTPGTFATLTRTWADGDKIELSLPKRLEIKAADDTHPDLVALVNGPMVLFAIGHDLPDMTRERLLAARQTAPASAEWRSGDTRFLPWWIIKNEVYTTYHRV